MDTHKRYMQKEKYQHQHGQYDMMVDLYKTQHKRYPNSIPTH